MYTLTERCRSYKMDCIQYKSASQAARQISKESDIISPQSSIRTYLIHCNQPKAPFLTCIIRRSITVKSALVVLLPCLVVTSYSLIIPLFSRAQILETITGAAVDQIVETIIDVAGVPLSGSCPQVDK